MSKSTQNKNPKFAAQVAKGLARARNAARKTARMYGTPIYVSKNGKVVAERP
jgi:hypothetical protein